MKQMNPSSTTNRKRSTQPDVETNTTWRVTTWMMTITYCRLHTIQLKSHRLNKNRTCLWKDNHKDIMIILELSEVPFHIHIHQHPVINLQCPYCNLLILWLSEMQIKLHYFPSDKALASLMNTGRASPFLLNTVLCGIGSVQKGLLPLQIADDFIEQQTGLEHDDIETGQHST